MARTFGSHGSHIGNFPQEVTLSAFGHTFGRYFFSLLLYYRISRRISRVSGHQNRGQKIDFDLYEGHIISVVRLLIKNLACLTICSF